MTIRKIRFRQSGGFAGLIRGCDLELSSLDPRERTKLEKAVEKSGLIDEPSEAGAKTGRSAAARDTAQLEIEIETSSGVIRRALDELDLPQRAEPLVSLLQERSRPLPLDP